MNKWKINNIGLSIFRYLIKLFLSFIVYFDKFN